MTPTWKSLLSRLRSPARPARKPRPSDGRGRRHSLALERLEDRTVPSTFQMRLTWTSGGGGSLTVADGGPGDGDATTGSITYIGPAGNFALNVDSGDSKPAHGSAASPDMDLLFKATKLDGSGADTLTIEISDTGFTTSPLTMTSQIGGTLSDSVSQVTSQAFFDNANAPFGTGGGSSALQTFTTAAFNGTEPLGVSGAAPYSLTERVVVAAGAGGGTTGGDFETFGTGPQPASPTITTTPNLTNVTLGTSTVTLKDTADLEGGNSPTGTITFTLVGPGNTVFDTETATVNGNGSYATPTGFTLPTSAAATGTYQWNAVYNGDTNNNTASDTGAANERVTVGPATPAINTTPNLTSVTLGTSTVTLKDTAVLSGGYFPIGTITFTLVGPGNTVLDTETATVNGNGSYTTPTGFTLPTSAAATGTYQWNASYSGDTNNNGASDIGAANERVVVTPATPAINTEAGNAVVIGSGNKLTDTAQLTGGFSPTGTITFTLTLNSNIVDTETVTVNGNGSYSTPNGFLPTVTGTYQWLATYGGDSNNGGAIDQGGAVEQQVVQPASPAIVTTPGQTSTTTGGGVGFATIGFWHNQNGQAVITNFDTGAGSTVLGNSLAGTYGNLFGAANPYVGTSLAGLTNTQVAAAYLGTWTPSGLQKNTYVQAFAVALGSHAAGGAGTFNVGSNGAMFGVADNTAVPITQILSVANANFNPATGLFFGGDSTQTSALNGVLDGINTSGEAAGGSSVVSTTTHLMDSATLSGGVNETGTLTFYLMGPGSTAATPLTGAVYTDTVTVNGNGTYTTAAGTNPGGYVPAAAGTYQWVAVYSGDANNNSVTSPFGSEPWVVGTQTPTITTVPTPNSVTLSSASVLLNDTATLQDATNPTGTITFTLLAPNGTTLYTDVVTVNGNGNYDTSTGTNPGGYTLPANAATGTYQWNATYSGDGNNAAASDIGDKSEQVVVTSPPAPPPVPVGSGEFATIGFWHNKNGQAVIDSFNGGSTQTALGSSLATNFPHLFGASNPYVGTSLAGLTNAQVAADYLGTWNPSGVTKNTYVQAFAVALGVYADTSGLGYNSTAAKYGFKSVSGGGGSLTFNVGSNGAAFGVANGTSLTVADILTAANANFDPKTGKFYGGDQTLTSELNNVLNGINTNGDIALVNSDAAVAADTQPLATALHPLDTGTLVVAVDALTGADAAAEQARIDDAIARLNATLAGFGLTLVEETGGDDPNADIHLHLSATSAIGGVADGVLGVTEAGGQITIVTGWNYFAGSDAAGMAAGQYDFETVVMHELGHAVGLGHSTDGGSVMYPSLGTDQSRRVLTAADLAVIAAAEDGSPEPLLAAGFTAPGVPVAAAALAPVAVAMSPAVSAVVPTSAPAGVPSVFAPVFVGDTAAAPVAAPAAINFALLPPVGTTLPAATDSGPASDESAFNLPAGAPASEDAWGKDWLFDPSSPFGDGGGAGDGADGEDADAAAADALEDGDLVLSGVAVDGGE